MYWRVWPHIMKRRQHSFGAPYLINPVVYKRDTHTFYGRFVMTFLLYTSRFSKTLPAPRATQNNGSSAMCAGTPVSIVINESIFRSNAPPPDTTIPRSIISEHSSGGVFSRTCFII